MSIKNPLLTASKIYTDYRLFRTALDFWSLIDVLLIILVVVTTIWNYPVGGTLFFLVFGGWVLYIYLGYRKNESMLKPVQATPEELNKSRAWLKLEPLRENLADLSEEYIDLNSKIKVQTELRKMYMSDIIAGASLELRQKVKNCDSLIKLYKTRLKVLTNEIKELYNTYLSEGGDKEDLSFLPIKG